VAGGCAVGGRSGSSALQIINKRADIRFPNLAGPYARQPVNVKQ
jgi:hypothetical protein